MENSDQFNPFDKDGADTLTIWRSRMRSAVKKLKEGRLSSRLDTSDLVQEGMLQAWQNIGSFRGTTEQEFDVWIKKIASGHAANASRYHHAEKRDIAQEAISEALQGNDARDPGERDPGEQAERSETICRIAELIDSFEPRISHVFTQHLFEQRSFADIATEMECSAGTVRNIYIEAVQWLGKQLATEGGQ